MKTIRRILAAAAVIAAVLASTAAFQGTASASTVPVVYNTGADGWVAQVRPSAIYFGQGGSPILSGLTWHSWGQGSAWATGKLWTQVPGCTPSYKCAYHSRWAGVYLSVVRLHNGHRYFARMAVRYFASGRAHWDTGWFPRYYCSGCTAVWQFPTVWPYL